MRSIHQGRGLRFPCNDRTDEVNKLFIIRPLSTIQKKSIIKGKTLEVKLALGGSLRRSYGSIGMLIFFFQFLKR